MKKKLYERNLYIHKRQKLLHIKKRKFEEVKQKIREVENLVNFFTSVPNILCADYVFNVHVHMC